MTRPRRRFLRLAVGAAMLPALAPMAAARSYPSRPVTLVVPFAAGGPVDVLARIMAERMKVSLGQPVIIENVAGAAGSIGVARRPRGAGRLHAQHRARLQHPRRQRRDLRAAL